MCSRGKHSPSVEQSHQDPNTGTPTVHQVHLRCKPSIVLNETNMQNIPEIGSYSLSRRDTIVDFPAPLGPTRAITEPAGMERLKSLKIDVSGRVGYANSTSLNSKAPLNVSLLNVIPSVRQRVKYRNVNRNKTQVSRPTTCFTDTQ